MEKYNLDKAYSAHFYTKREHWKSKVYKKMAHCIDEKYDPNSVIDLGCGSGFILKNINADLKQGIEGSKHVLEIARIDNNLIDIRDLRNKIYSDYPKYDIAVSIEVAEHIEPQFANNFVENITNLSDNIIITAAPPNQTGNHHVNCQPKLYWVKKFKHFDFYIDKVNLAYIQKCWKNNIPNKYSYLYDNLLIFKKEVS